MEIRITSAQTQENIMSRINQILSENGIKSQIHSLDKAGELRLTLATEKENIKAAKADQNRLGSSFVYSDHAPGY